MSQMIGFRIPDDVHERLAAKATKLGMSPGEAARLAALSWIGEAKESEAAGPVEDDDLLDLANLIVAKYNVARQVAVRWIKGAYIRVDGLGVWKEPLLPAEFKDRILAGKELDTAEKSRQRALRAKRTAVAEEHGIAIGQVDEHGEVLPGAKKLPEDVLKARKEAAK